MSLQFKETPRVINKYLKPYMAALTKTQQQHFTTFITGIIIKDKKTIQEINDCISMKDKSNLNRTLVQWDMEQLNGISLARVQRMHPSKDDGLLITDNTLSHKTGNHMESAGNHRSGVTKQNEWGHNIVNSYCMHPDWKFGYPVIVDIFTNKDDTVHPYRPIKRMALEQVRYARTHNVRGIFCTDSLYYADYVVREIETESERYLLGVPSTLKISVKRAPRVSVFEYFESERFEKVDVGETSYRITSVEGSIRKVGKRRIICSFPDGREDEKKYYVTDLTYPNNELMKLLVCRWSIVC